MPRPNAPPSALGLEDGHFCRSLSLSSRVPASVVNCVAARRVDFSYLVSPVRRRDIKASFSNR